MFNRQEAIKEAVNAGDLLRLHVADENVREQIAVEVAQRVTLALAQAAQAAHQYEAETDGDGIALESQFYSVGRCCQMLQVGPQGLRTLMRDAGVRFACSFNGVPQLSGAALEKVAQQWQWLQRQAGAEAGKEA